MSQTTLQQPRSQATFQPTWTPAPARATLLQRKCACGGTPGTSGECEECRKKKLQRKTRNAEPGTRNDSAVPPVVHEVLGSPGQPLAPATRALMEPRFGHDFGQVRVHSDARAAESARSVGADAFTAGPDVVFGAAQFAPEPPAGQRLLAHELTHVLQQSRAERPPILRPAISEPVAISPGRGGKANAPVEVSHPSDATEREAELVAERLFPTSAPAPGNRAASPEPVAESDPTHGRQARPASGSAPPCATCGSSGKALGGAADHGSALPAETRLEMERAFNADFSTVRIHTNSGAAQVSRSLRASAFTFGNDIFFDHGKYDPRSPAGKRLLAHELTHTVQQRDAIAVLAREGTDRTTLQCVNENLSSAGVASWLIGIVGVTCGLIGALAGSPTGPGAAGTAAAAAAVCIAGVVGFSVGFVLGIIIGCVGDPNFKSPGANPR